MIDLKFDFKILLQQEKNRFKILMKVKMQTEDSRSKQRIGNTQLTFVFDKETEIDIGITKRKKT